MKNLSRILSLVIALVMLCSTAALAEDTAVSLSVSNPVLMMDDEVLASIEATVALDVAVNMETLTASGFLAALTGDTTALKAGFTYDGTDLLGDIAGMTKAAKIPMTQLMSEMDVESLLSSIDGASEMMPTFEEGYILGQYIASLDGETLAQMLSAFIAGINVEHTDDMAFNAESDDRSLVGSCDDFTMTVKDLWTALNNAMAVDAQLDALWKDCLNAILVSAGAEGTDLDAVIAEVGDSVSVVGYVLTTDNGDAVFSIDLVAAEETMLTFEVVSYNDADAVRTSVYMDEPSDMLTMLIDICVPVDETVDAEISAYIDTTDENGEGLDYYIAATKPADTTDYDVMFYFNQSEYTLNEGNLEEEPVYFMLTYKGGEAEMTETGLFLPGTVYMSLEKYGSTMSLTFDTKVGMYASEGAIYTVNGEPVDVTAADEEAMAALEEDAANALMNGLSALMQAPGLSDLMAMMG